MNTKQLKRKREHREMKEELKDRSVVVQDSKRKKQSLILSHLNEVPDELFYMEIFSYLEFESLAKCAMVCKKWFNASAQTATSLYHDTITGMVKNTNYYCVLVASVCRHFTNIQELSLHDCGFINIFNEQENAYIETVMGNLNNIRKLEIHGLRITDFACREFSRTPKPFLQELKLDHCMISDYGFSNLARNNTLSNVYSLSVTASAIELDSCKELSNLTNLKILDLSHNCISSEGAKYLSSCLQNMEYLDLSFNNIEEGFESLCSQKNTSMRKLIIVGNNIPGSACKNIGNFESITHLDMTGNPLGYEGASFISKGLKEIRTLKIADAKINSSAMIYLSEGIMNNLSELSLEGNFFGDEGCVVFQSPMFSNLKKLKLNRNCITCFGCENLACDTLKSLQELNLSFNRIKTRGINFLSEGKFENLEVLNLTSNFLPTIAIPLFKKPVFSKLKVLLLMGNRFSTCSSSSSLKDIFPQLQLTDC
ncbi:LRR_RI domain-containing protein [Naegleria gruberi]|uniref:LRR_RI domain-containing protein n=1 Tax=Naegleria gruberi TaxID=5762 RepID=D2VZN8_NAEGR|nr:LRR_RI domain-containing protein [Naegleria gruberi]EFC37728.1 LRR_RI domain-containing protein [Naegleria gruberi]|eukprot:XP_002670472.1 LRR_RI domain-containing protein [Naegleria gruberi strain NEG-M]